MIPSVRNLVSVASQLIEGPENFRVNHIESKSELDTRKEVRYWAEVSDHPLLSSRNIVGEKLLEYLFQFIICKGARNDRHETNVLSNQLTHGAAQIRNIKWCCVDLGRKMLLTFLLVSAERPHSWRVFVFCFLHGSQLSCLETTGKSISGRS